MTASSRPTDGHRRELEQVGRGVGEERLQLGHRGRHPVGEVAAPRGEDALDRRAGQPVTRDRRRQLARDGVPSRRVAAVDLVDRVVPELQAHLAQQGLAGTPLRPRQLEAEGEQGDHRPPRARADHEAHQVAIVVATTHLAAAVGERIRLGRPGHGPRHPAKPGSRRGLGEGSPQNARSASLRPLGSRL